jgi:hypothetical protein
MSLFDGSRSHLEDLSHGSMLACGLMLPCSMDLGCNTLYLGFDSQEDKFVEAS